MCRRIPRAALLAALLLPVLASGGCGGKDEGSPASVDRTAWKPTFEAAMDALTSPERVGLLRLLSPEGRVQLDADLAQLGKSLAHPLQGPPLLAKIRARWPEIPDALIVSTRAGNLDDAWRLWMRASTPPGVRPQQAGMKLEKNKPDDMALLYRYGAERGDELEIRLKRIHGRWFVDFIQLGSELR